MSVKIRDRGAKALLRRIRADKNGPRNVLVGVFEESDGRSDGYSNIQIGANAELGIGQPVRSWLRAYFDASHEDMRAGLAEIALGYRRRTGRPAREALEKMGRKMVSDIRAKIRARIPPPNAPATLAQKDGNTPLIDTKQFIQSILSKVVR